MIKKLAKSIREYKKDSLLSPFFVSLEVIMEVVIPLLMAYLIDNGINGNNEKGDISTILIYGGALIVSCLISLVFGALAGKYAASASNGFARNLRHDMYYRIQEYSFANIDKFSSASLVTRLTTDITNVQMAYQMIVRVAVRSPMMLICSLAMAFSISPRLSLIFVAAIPVLALGIYCIITKAHPIFEKVFKTYDKLNGVVQENLRGIRVVKSFVREDHEIEKFGVISEDINRNFTKAQRLVAFNMPLMQFIMYACLLLISWFGARLIVGSGGADMTTGQLTSLITYSTQILSSLMMFSMILIMVVISRASAERIVEVLDEQSDLANCANPLFEIPDGSVKFENVSFSYSKNKDKRCLKNINIDIKSGETVGIIGGTGSSKSSFISLISRLYDVTDGTLYVGGHDVRKYDIQSLRDAVSTVLQKNVLFSGTIKDNLRWGDENASDDDIVRVCRLAAADEFIEKFPNKYDTYIEQGGTNVSGGQKQRLCIARALLKKPKILILDDSTSAVDTHTDAQIRRAMADELPQTTKFIIAQRISSVEHADKIIVLDHGEVIDAGTHDYLIENNDIYREVYNSQTNGFSGNKEVTA